MNRNVWLVKNKNPNKKNKDWLKIALSQNRGLKTKKEIEDFLNPSFEQILEQKITDTQKAISRIIKAIGNKEKIIVYSDYDADGICATAIMWETLNDFGADVMPYVPHRIKEGYGLAISAIDELKAKGVSLIITVDHGVTAKAQVEHAKKLGIDVVVTDHHVLPKDLPNPVALVHTTSLCGAGVSWRLCWELAKKIKPGYEEKLKEKLEFAAIATIADLVPLLSANRSIVKLGLEYLNKTKKFGLKALINACGITGEINTYHVSHIIAPRINAMGRIEHGLDSLRLICAVNKEKAESLAELLSVTNSKRQNLTNSAIDTAYDLVSKKELIGVIHHESWHEGVIGLVASRMVENYKIPIIAISKKENFSKGSARSIPGFNIVEAIRSASEFLVDAGGHPMAAGFTIKTEHIEIFRSKMQSYAKSKITESMLNPKIEIECELSKEEINKDTLEIVEEFEPFGMGNFEPAFLTKGFVVEDVRGVGLESRHLKLTLDGFSCIFFNHGNLRAQLRPGYKVDAVYTISEDHFYNNGQMSLKIKDLLVKAN